MPGDVTMVNDYARTWLDARYTAAEFSYDANYGLNTHRATCYVALGRRWTIGTWPGTDAYYQGPCR